MKGAWQTESMLTALKFYLQQKQTKPRVEAQGETYRLMPDIPRVTLWRRTLLLESGVPVEIACKKDLPFTELSKYLDEDITSMTALEAKFKQSVTKKLSIKDEANNISFNDSCLVGYNGNSERKFCSVPRCKSDSELQPHLTFFRLPDDDQKLALWAERCQKPEWADPAKINFVKKYTLVCAHHFSKTMFHDLDKKKLTEDAFPAVINESLVSNIPIAVINLDQNGCTDKDPLEVDPLDLENPTSSSTVVEDNEPPLPKINQVSTVEPSQLEIMNVSTNLNVPDENQSNEVTLPRILRKRSQPTDMSYIQKRLIFKLKTKNISSQRKRTIQTTLFKRKKHPFDPAKRVIRKNANCSVPKCSKFCKERFFVCTPCMEKGFVACAVPKCKKLYNSSDSNASYVYFPPNNNDLNNKWKSAIGSNGDWDSTSAVICLKHFQKPQDFSNDGLSLKLNAVPSVGLARGKSHKKKSEQSRPSTSKATASSKRTPLASSKSTPLASSKSMPLASKTTPLASSKTITQPPKRTVPSRSSTSTNNFKLEPGQSSTINQKRIEQNECKKQRLSVSKVKALLTIRGLRLKNEHLSLQNEKLRLQNLILEKQLEKL